MTPFPIPLINLLETKNCLINVGVYTSQKLFGLLRYETKIYNLIEVSIFVEMIMKESQTDTHRPTPDDRHSDCDMVGV